ncbi:MAG: hypothetical protein SGJ04_01795 [Bacteroidota bacterium]|nr:hypothetical protein [Bacteroidota bacterium]
MNKTTRTTLTTLLTAALLMVMFTANAQSTISWRLGPTVGIQYTDLSTNLGSFSGKVGINAGLSNDIKFSRKFGVDVNLLYSSYRADRDYLDSNLFFDRYQVYRYKTSETYNYFQAQILAKYIIELGHIPIIPYDDPDARSAITLELKGGGFFNTLAFWSWDSYDNSGTYEFYSRELQSGAKTATTKQDAALTTAQKPFYVNPMDFGLALGAGLNFRLSKRTDFGIDAKYLRGFSNLDYGTKDRYQYGNPTLVVVDPADPSKNFIGYNQAKVNSTAYALNFSFRFKVLGIDPE